MPPQVTFVKITNDFTIPIKIFVKKKPTTTTSGKSTSLAINSKSLITLNNQPYQIQLSHNYLNTIITKLKPEILPVLIDNENLETQEFKLDNLKVVVSQQAILRVRLHLRLISPEHELMKKITRLNHNLEMIDVKKVYVGDKDTVDFKLSSSWIVGNLRDCIKVYVY